MPSEYGRNILHGHAAAGEGVLSANLTEKKRRHSKRRDQSPENATHVRPLNNARFKSSLVIRSRQGVV